MKYLILFSLAVLVINASATSKKACDQYVTDIHSVSRFLDTHKDMTFDEFQKTTYAQALKLTKPVKQRERFLKTIYKDSSEMVNTPGFDIEKLPSELKGMSENCVIK